MLFALNLVLLHIYFTETKPKISLWSCMETLYNYLFFLISVNFGPNSQTYAMYAEWFFI